MIIEWEVALIEMWAPSGRRIVFIRTFRGAEEATAVSCETSLVFPMVVKTNDSESVSARDHNMVPLHASVNHFFCDRR